MELENKHWEDIKGAMKDGGTKQVIKLISDPENNYIEIIEG